MALNSCVTVLPHTSIPLLRSISTLFFRYQLLLFLILSLSISFPSKSLYPILPETSSPSVTALSSPSLNLSYFRLPFFFLYNNSLYFFPLPFYLLSYIILPLLLFILYLSSALFYPSISIFTNLYSFISSYSIPYLFIIYYSSFPFIPLSDLFLYHSFIPYSFHQSISLLYIYPLSPFFFLYVALTFTDPVRFDAYC